MRKAKNTNLIGTREVYRQVAERGHYKKCEVRACLDILAGVVAEALAEGKAVRYAPLGTFKPVRRKARGKDAFSVTVRFRPAAAVLRKLNQNQKGGGHRE